MTRAPEPPLPSGTSASGAWVGVAALVGLLALHGWWIFWFLTDDAYIAFRYASNWLAGRGLVWNPPPFQPVEGYTSFAWVALLAGGWWLTGIEPPALANVLSLVFGLLSLLAVGLGLARMPLPAPLERHRVVLAAAALLATAGNRTFATWLSSGLETALFNACAISWFVLACAPRVSRSGRWLAVWSALAAATALTRPGGLLLVAATLPLAVWGGPRGQRIAAPRRLAAATPLAAVPLHLLWRRLTYGEWLPNTYAAKVVAPWPEAGLRYLGSFVLEYGLWVWAALAALAVWRLARRPAALRETLLRRPAAPFALAALTLHGAYYTLIVGGDHFEYRVYSYWIPLLFASAVLLAAFALRRPLPVYGAIVLFAAASLPLPWTHWQLTRSLDSRQATKTLYVRLAPHLPSVMRPLTETFDRWQAWLIGRKICMRHQEHKIFEVYQRSQNPSRSRGARVSWEQRAVMGRLSVGVPGWVFPNVAIIDKRGLNDRIVANRHPRQLRQMAHDRAAPRGYVECFAPNLLVRRDRFQLLRRDEPLTDERIRECEERYSAWTRRGPPQG